MDGCGLRPEDVSTGAVLYHNSVALSRLWCAFPVIPRRNARVEELCLMLTYDDKRKNDKDLKIKSAKNVMQL
jgi:hypothetical protein